MDEPEKPRCDWYEKRYVGDECLIFRCTLPYDHDLVPGVYLTQRGKHKLEPDG